MHRKRFLIGGVIFFAAIPFLVSRGMQQARVYFRTPSEIKGNEAKYNSQSLRVGGMVVKGSLHRNADGLTYRFQLTDGKANVPVHFHGVTPGLFGGGRGAGVEGRLGTDGVFMANTIMAKHAEEYSPEEHGKPNSPKGFVPAPEEKKS